VHSLPASLNGGGSLQLDVNDEATFDTPSENDQHSVQQMVPVIRKVAQHLLRDINGFAC
jgi:hypothetical protein